MKEEFPVEGEEGDRQKPNEEEKVKTERETPRTGEEQESLKQNDGEVRPMIENDEQVDNFTLTEVQPLVEEQGQDDADKEAITHLQGPHRDKSEESG